MKSVGIRPRNNRAVPINKRASPHAHGQPRGHALRRRHVGRGVHPRINRDIPRQNRANPRAHGQHRRRLPGRQVVSPRNAGPILRRQYRPTPRNLRPGPPPLQNPMPRRGALPQRIIPMPPPPPRNLMPQKNGPPPPRNPIRHNMRRMMNSIRPGAPVGRNWAPPTEIGQGAMGPSRNQRPNHASFMSSIFPGVSRFLSQRDPYPPPRYSYPPVMGSLTITDGYSDGYTNEPYEPNYDSASLPAYDSTYDPAYSSASLPLYEPSYNSAYDSNIGSSAFDSSTIYNGREAEVDEAVEDLREIRDLMRIMLIWLLLGDGGDRANLRRLKVFEDYINCCVIVWLLSRCHIISFHILLSVGKEIVGKEIRIYTGTDSTYILHQSLF